MCGDPFACRSPLLVQAPRRAPARLLRQAASPVDVAAVSSTVAAAVDPTSRVKLEVGGGALAHGLWGPP